MKLIDADRLRAVVGEIRRCHCPRWGSLWAVTEGERGPAAGRLNDLAIHLASAGKHAKVLSAIQEAVTIRRGLAEIAPATYLPDLAGSLNNLGGELAEAGRRTEALIYAQEATQLFRQFAEAVPTVYLPMFAGSLNNLAVILAEIGRYDEACAAKEEAIRIMSAT